MEASKLKKAVQGLFNNLKMSLPILTGVLLLIGLLNASVSEDFFAGIFSGRKLLDPFIGAVFGSVAAGHPLTSYVIGGELLRNGVSLIAVFAFIVSWVTVGTVQLPAESLMLGKRFALVRNGLCFVMAVLIALLAAFTLRLL